MRINRTATIEGLDKIEKDIENARRRYETTARHDNYTAWVKLHNLEREREMLETLLG